MSMKEHMLRALREQFNHLEELLATMSDEQITGSRTLADWSTKDVIAHLWMWQQISVARMEAAVQDREPELPRWVARLHTDWEENANQTNNWVYETYHQQSWSITYQLWREGFLHFLELGERIPEKDLLDSGRYPWLEGNPLALILLASYDHHQEHLEKLTAWLKEHGR